MDIVVFQIFFMLSNSMKNILVCEALRLTFTVVAHMMNVLEVFHISIDRLLYVGVADFFFFFFNCDAWHAGSPTRDQTHTPAVEAHSPNQWTTREFPKIHILQLINSCLF